MIYRADGSVKVPLHDINHMTLERNVKSGDLSYGVLFLRFSELIELNDVDALCHTPRDLTKRESRAQPSRLPVFHCVFWTTFVFLLSSCTEQMMRSVVY